MDIKAKILFLLKQKHFLTGKELISVLHITRQALNRHLQPLIKGHFIQKTGATKGVIYYLSKIPLIKTLKTPLKNIEEDQIYKQFIVSQKLYSINKNTSDVLYYTFTEMLNNAKDHSKSKMAKISLYLSPTHIGFRITDEGVGIFKHIQKAKNLTNAYRAIEELLKGKCTTDPKHHTGEGIFFTSKAVDLFSIESLKLALEIDNIHQDYTIKNSDIFKGTSVYCQIPFKSHLTLLKLFKTYTKEYKFSKTRIYITLFDTADQFMSRSEAKRVLFGLEKSQEIVFDFKGVQAIGQAFADEIFRVFHARYPHIVLTAINTNRTIQFMIQRSK